jgi:hypothetical protein
MNENVLRGFQDLAATLQNREKWQIGVVTDQGTVTAVYDPLFKTVSIAGMTVPAKELVFWVKVACHANVIAIKCEAEQK